MSPVAVVSLIAVIAFLFGAAAPVVFGPSEEERTPVGPIGWLVRGLVGAAVAHTALAVYSLIEQARHSDGLDAIFLSSTMAGLFVDGGILLGFAALVHLLGRRFAAPPAR
ncbi:MAG TPA: hypothetical protein VFU94_11815 [Conexibacter sp.]|nr:hypothetical protein [Conexibacter sp.]